MALRTELWPSRFLRYSLTTSHQGLVSLQRTGQAPVLATAGQMCEGFTKQEMEGGFPPLACRAQPLTSGWPCVDTPSRPQHRSLLSPLSLLRRPQARGSQVGAAGEQPRCCP